MPKSKSMISINELLKIIIIPVNKIPQKNNQDLFEELTEFWNNENKAEISVENFKAKLKELNPEFDSDEILEMVERYDSGFHEYNNRERKKMVLRVTNFLSVSQTFNNKTKEIEFNELGKKQLWEVDCVYAFLIGVIADSYLYSKNEKFSYYGLLDEVHDSKVRENGFSKLVGWGESKA